MSKKVSVIGGGIIGLWTAEVLSTRGHKVTLYTSQPLSSTCSSSAACVITPLLPTEWSPKEDKFITAWGRYRRTIDKFRLIDEKRNTENSFLEAMPSHEFGFEENGEKFLEKGFNIKILKHLPFTKIETIDLPKPVSVKNHDNEYHMCSFYTRFVADFCNTEVFISYLYEELARRGVAFKFLTIKSIDEIRDLGADVVFNCMGFESPNLFPDDSLYYVRGQSMFIDAEQLDGPYFGIASGHHAIFRHRRGYYLGSYFIEENRTTRLFPRQSEYRLSLEFANDSYKRLCKSLGFEVPYLDFSRISQVNIGIRPFRPDGPRVEADDILEDHPLKPLRVIHNYGHGAHGWTVGYASAEDAVNIAEVRGWLS